MSHSIYVKFDMTVLAFLVRLGQTRRHSLVADPAVWMTYGSYRSRKRSIWKRLRPWPRKPSTRPYPDDVLRERAFREERWWAGHPMTFRRFLFDAVKDEDLKFGLAVVGRGDRDRCDTDRCRCLESR